MRHGTESAHGVLSSSPVEQLTKVVEFRLCASGSGVERIVSEEEKAQKNERAAKAAITDLHERVTSRICCGHGGSTEM
jgi:hypothetical protein